MKQCSKCKKIKPLADFYDDKRLLLKKQSQCKECFKKGRKRYYYSNVEKVKKTNNRWVKANRDKVRQNYKKWSKNNKLNKPFQPSFIFNGVMQQ